MKAKIHITLKNGVLDPQGKAVQTALAGLGFTGVNDVNLSVNPEGQCMAASPNEAIVPDNACENIPSFPHRVRNSVLKAKQQRLAYRCSLSIASVLRTVLGKNTCVDCERISGSCFHIKLQ